MKSQMNYRTKRNVIIVAIIALLIILASVGIYSYIKGNSETQAMSEMNGTSGERAGEDVQIAQEDNGEMMVKSQQKKLQTMIQKRQAIMKKM